MDSTSATFAAARAKDPSFEYGTCLAWFYDSFYQRLFAVHPSCRSLFKGDLQVQGRALVRMISVCLQQLKAEDPAQLTVALQKLAQAHAARGVVSNEYFLVGETLLWTLERYLGEQFDPARARCGPRSTRAC